MKPVTAGGPYRVPPEPSRWPAIALAVAVHALLLAFLWFGIDWQNNAPVQVEAEVWDMKVQAAAPPPPPPPEEVEPEPQPAPAPKVVEQQVEQPVTPPDINLEREKKRKEQLKKEQEQREEREAQKAREEAKAKELADKKAAEKKLLAEQKEAEKKAAAAEKKKAEKLAKAKEAAENAKLAKLRAEAMKSIAGAAGTVGSAAKSTAPHSDTGYLAAISSKVKSTTSYLGSTDVAGNPRVEFRVDQLPTGEILSVRKIKSSGVAAFDEAVEKGIIKASPLPKKKDGTVERSLEIGFSMKDMN